MSLVLADRVKETTTTTGQGTITLNGAVTGYQTFAAVGNGNTTYYTIAGQGTSEWEVGIGTYTAAGTTLSRDTVLASSAGAPTKTTFTAGTKDVFVTYPSERAVDVVGNTIVANNMAATQGDLLYASATDTFSRLAKDANATRYLSNTGTTNNPAWAQISLTTGVTGILPVANGGVTTTVQTFNTGTAATWTKPTAANFVTIQLWGGGGSGGCGVASAPGGGGGGGAFNTVTVPFSYLVGAVTYTVGTGGAAQTAASTAGNSGTDSSVSIANYNGTGTTVTLTAYAGGAGGYALAGGGGGGGGGQMSGGVGGGGTTFGNGGGPLAPTTAGTDSTLGGGSGGTNIAAGLGGTSYYGGGGGGGAFDGAGTGANVGGNSTYGGGGGGGAVNSATPGTGGTSIFGGAGSAGTVNGTASSAGTAPAGGSGGTEGGASGAGGAGRIVFIYW